jgi:ribosomal protein L29
MISRKKKEKVSDELIIDDLEKQAFDLEVQLFALKNELATNKKLDRPHLLKSLRHDRARLLTKITLQRRKQNA